MTTTPLSRRELLGTTAKALAAFSAVSGASLLGIAPTQAAAHTCMANHRNLARNLAVLVRDPNVGETERAFALKTCRCVHCDSAITPMLT